MTVALLRTIENFKTLLKCYEEIEAGDVCSREVATPVYVVSDPNENRKLNLMRTEEAMELSKALK